MSEEAFFCVAILLIFALTAVVEIIGSWLARELYVQIMLSKHMYCTPKEKTLTKKILRIRWMKKHPLSTLSEIRVFMLRH